ncbi:hypothetical protein PIB30_010279 [Stylosanthes scabra]|uniref:Uncharacterized protein n=1 Tax=Stylosanthes scabra TaxID=79078 RepID=A0ABU6T5F1_9FABA|nr:hypothetical protein [Stylosanthes scabra]
MTEEDSFLALVHHDGEVKHSSREGVKFTSKNPTNVFFTPRTRLSDLQRNIQRKICSNGRKRIGMIYYHIPIFVVAQGVMYGSFAIQADEDLQRVLDPGVEEALWANDSDDEPPFIEGDSEESKGGSATDDSDQDCNG